MKFKTLTLLIFTFCITLTANAQILSKSSIAEPTSAFRSYLDVNNLQINTPTVVEISLTNDFMERLDFAVFDVQTNSFEPYFFQQKSLVNNASVFINTVPNVNNSKVMIDNNSRTYTDFYLPDSGQANTVKITLSSSRPITSSALTVLLDKNVSLPSSVEIRALVDGENRIVVANKKVAQQTIAFPRTTSDRWTITFVYNQPLRISELRLNQEDVDQSQNNTLRFLAQPAHSYKVYLDSDRLVDIKVSEAGNLAGVEEVLLVNGGIIRDNPSYVIADIDGDKIPDILDNCVEIANFDQQDLNNNYLGDACEDFDKDGLMNDDDNCPNNPNRNQEDVDSDGIGDACDTEESRITERNAWLPWAGIVFASIVLVVLLILTARSNKKTF